MQTLLKIQILISVKIMRSVIFWGLSLIPIVHKILRWELINHPYSIVYCDKTFKRFKVPTESIIHVKGLFTFVEVLDHYQIHCPLPVSNHWYKLTSVHYHGYPKLHINDSMTVVSLICWTLSVWSRTGVYGHCIYLKHHLPFYWKKINLWEHVDSIIVKQNLRSYGLNYIIFIMFF